MGAFNLNYFRGMDKYLSPHEENRFIEGAPSVGDAGGPKLSKPIVSIKKLGSTIKGQNTNFGGTNILGALTAQIRGGSSTVQLAGFTLADASLTGASKRQAIKEALKASGVTWEGLEFASEQLTGVSGFDLQSNTFSDQFRQNQVSHVKDAIKFAADIGAGGGVDIWSREFSRSITGNFDGFVDFEGAKEEIDQMYTLVDDRTGKTIHQFQTGQLGGQGMESIAVPVWEKAKSNYTDGNGVLVQKGDYIDAGGNKLNPDINSKDFVMNRAPKWNEKERKFDTKKMKWNEFKDYARELNDELGTNLSAAEWVGRLQIEQQYAQTRGQAIYYQSFYKRAHQDYMEAIDAKKNETQIRKETDFIVNSRNKQKELEMKFRSGNLSEEEQKKIEKEYQQINEDLNQIQEKYPGYDPETIVRINTHKIESISQIDALRTDLQHSQESSSRADAQANVIWDNLEHIKTMDDYGKQKTFESYADLGIEAMKTTKQHKDLSAPIYVGPELGFPQGYGGHTDEFIEIIQNSRAEMVKKMENDPYFRNKYKNDEIEEMAKTHIRGVMDTAHLSMWFNHFPKEGNESEDRRLERFNDWYLEQMEKLGEADVIGSIQVVDSATGDHAHLPIGEGIFPTVEGIKVLQKHGFDGIVVSEGHMYEDVEPGSTQFSLWNEFGASIGSRSGYFATPGVGNSFSNVFSNTGAAGYGAPVNYIVGSYSPSNDWQLWSGTPLE